MYKLLFLTTLVMGTLITISSNSWLGVWMGLEMNLLSIIPLMNNSKSPKSTEASLKYFITQAMASLILLMGMMMDSIKSDIPSNIWTESLFFLCITTSLVTKTGAAPFHFWFPEVVEGLDWFNALLMLTWQKIAPMITLMYINMNETLITFLMLTSIAVGGVMGLNQTSMKKIMSYSSINHIGWMLGALVFTETLWSWYFLIYSITNSLIIWAFSKFNISSISQFLMVSKTAPQLKMFLTLNFLSLGGIPPFIGFLPKWLTIQVLVQNQMYFSSCLMVVMTLITLYFYMRIALSPLSLSTSNVIPINQKQKMNKKTFVTINSALLMSLMLSTLTFNWI
uniref:NADH-ubiquinone oxidoreductase chain 2 n=1 Tax=Agrilinae sp. 1 ACP-2013 TaxID=1434404 RepID=A0A3G5FNU7_9COLE|nr:NADH dehydrogenase subunit 2 [Agrilinae sp. 1 ACP-2013]